MYVTTSRGDGHKALIGYDDKLQPVEGQYKICLTCNDAAYRYDGEQRIAPARHVMCLNNKESVYSDESGIKVVYFSPEFLNVNFTLDYIERAESCGADEHLWFRLQPFLDRINYPYGAIPLFPQMYERVLNDIAVICDQLHDQPDWYWSCRARTALMDILVLLDKSLRFFPIAHDPLAAIMDYIHAHYNESISVNTLCGVSGLDRRHFSYLFHAHNRCGLLEYIASLRLTMACYDLAYTSVPITEIAYNRGFSSQPRLSEMMRKHTGMTPKQYRAQVVSDRIAYFKNKKDRPPLVQASGKEKECGKN